MNKHLVILILTFQLVLCKVYDDNERIEQNNIEYHPSSGLNLILSVPHGGWRELPNIPLREAGCWNESIDKCVWRHDCQHKNPLKCRAVTLGDLYTHELAMNVRSNLCLMFDGSCPAVVVNLLSRRQLDANRNLSEATFHVQQAEDAFKTFHEFIDTEKQRISTDIGSLLIDIHGHGHTIQRAELGYLLKSFNFDEDPRISLSRSSIRHLAAKMSNNTVKLNALLRGNESLGYFLEEQGYAAVPSLTFPSPGSDKYFNGGYNVMRHGSLKGGSVDAIQIESCRSARSPENIFRYSCALSIALKNFLCEQYISRDISNVLIQSCRVISSHNDCISI